MLAYYIYLVAAALDVLGFFMCMRRDMHVDALVWTAIAALNLTMAIRSREECS